MEKRSVEEIKVERIFAEKGDFKTLFIKALEDELERLIEKLYNKSKQTQPPEKKGAE